MSLFFWLNYGMVRTCLKQPNHIVIILLPSTLALAIALSGAAKMYIF
jgi:hypothetical protein